MPFVSSQILGGNHPSTATFASLQFMEDKIFLRWYVVCMTIIVTICFLPASHPTELVLPPKHITTVKLKVMILHDHLIFTLFQDMQLEIASASGSTVVRTNRPFPYSPKVNIRCYRWLTLQDSSIIEPHVAYFEISCSELTPKYNKAVGIGLVEASFPFFSFPGWTAYHRLVLAKNRTNLKQWA